MSQSSQGRAGHNIEQCITSIYTHPVHWQADDCESAGVISGCSQPTTSYFADACEEAAAHEGWLPGQHLDLSICGDCDPPPSTCDVRAFCQLHVIFRRLCDSVRNKTPCRCQSLPRPEGWQNRGLIANSTAREFDWSDMPPARSTTTRKNNFVNGPTQKRLLGQNESRRFYPRRWLQKCQLVSLPQLIKRLYEGQELDDSAVTPTSSLKSAHNEVI